VKPALKASLLAFGILAGGVVLWVAWVVLGEVYAGKKSMVRAEQAVLAISLVTGLAYLFGAIPVYRGARLFKASVTARFVVTLAYLVAAASLTGTLFFFTALAFNR
jgi:hypothetical protein